jgi:hypothetical protein
MSGSTILLIRHCTNGVTVTQCVNERVHHMWVTEERERQRLVSRHERRYTHGLGLQMSILYTPQTVALTHFLSILDASSVCWANELATLYGFEIRSRFALTGRWPGGASFFMMGVSGVGRIGYVGPGIGAVSTSISSRSSRKMERVARHFWAQDGYSSAANQRVVPRINDRKSLTNWPSGSRS